jgi:hypothetical protein
MIPRDQRLRMARVGAVVGVLAFLVAGPMAWAHPRPHHFGNPELAYLRLPGSGAFWIINHLLLAAAGILGAATLVIIAALMWEGRTPVLTKLALASAVGSAGFSLGFFVVDGIAGREVALDWVAATGERKAEAFATGAAVAHVASALEIGLQLFFIGVTLLVYGFAVAGSGVFSRRLGYAGIAAGGAGIVTGVLHAAMGTRPATVYPFLVATAVGFLWIGVMGTAMGIEAEGLAAASPAGAVVARDATRAV